MAPKNASNALCAACILNHSMTNAKNVYALMLALVIVLSGCFGATSDESDAQDSGSDDREQTDDSQDIDREDVDREEEHQARTWYTSGGDYATTWTDELGVASGSERCMEWGPSYDSQTGEYLGEECRRYGLPTQASDWNVTECTDLGGTPYWSNLEIYNNSDNDGNNSTNYAYRWAPSCIDIPILSINTSSGEALIVYQWTSGPKITTTCNDVSITSTPHSVGTYNGQESAIFPGSAMDCTHELTRSMQYRGDSLPNYSLWSIVYAIQDVTVVE